jgi:hypothetical protein
MIYQIADVPSDNLSRPATTRRTFSSHPPNKNGKKRQVPHLGLGPLMKSNAASRINVQIPFQAEFLRNK